MEINQLREKYKIETGSENTHYIDSPDHANAPYAHWLEVFYCDLDKAFKVRNDRIMDHKKEIKSIQSQLTQSQERADFLDETVNTFREKLKESQERCKGLAEYVQHKNCQSNSGIYGSSTYKHCNCGLDKLLSKPTTGD